MFTVVSQTRLHKSKGAKNPFLVKAHLPLPPSPSSSSSSSFFLGKVTWIRVIESMDDRRERIKYRTGRAFDCRLRWEGWKRTNEHVYTIFLDRRDAPFFPFLPPPLCIPLVLRVLFGSERVQGVPASDSFVVEAVISVHTRAWKCFVSRLGFWILWIVSTVLRWMYEDLFHSKNWRLLEKRRTSVD